MLLWAYNLKIWLKNLNLIVLIFSLKLILVGFIVYVSSGQQASGKKIFSYGIMLNGSVD